MELNIKEYKLPEVIEFNYDEIKQMLIDSVSHYETMVYTDEQIKEAKNDRANLNKFKKALNDKRIELEKEYMKPFNDFKLKVNELISIVDKPVAVIDMQITEYEEQKKQEKLKIINGYIEAAKAQLPDDVNIPVNSKWLNASVSLKSIQDAISTQAETIKTELDIISNLPEYAFEARQVYIDTFSLSKALNEANTLAETAKRKAEYEERQARLKEAAEAKAAIEKEIASEEEPQPAPEPKREWVSIRLLLTEADGKALKEFLTSRNIEFKAV